MQGQGEILVGLDVGTTKICAVVGEVSDHDINVIGIGTHPSIGLRKGVVVNIESTVESIKKAIEEGGRTWKTHPESMIRAMAIRELFRMIPASPKLAAALKVDDLTSNQVETYQ